MKLILLPLLLAGALAAQVITPPSTAVFDQDTVHEIRLTFAQADWYQILTTNYDTYPDDTPYTEASIQWGAYSFEKIGVRFKGNSSYRGATTKKKPFRIKLNEFVKGQKIDGMASFGLSNAWSDPSFVREKGYYVVAAAAGLPAPRSNFAALYVNGEYWGLYVLGEIVNSDFLKNHFASGDTSGNLYKAHDPGATLAYLGATAAPYQNYFTKESNEDEDDWSDLIELARVFDQTSTANLPAVLEPLIDVDSFLTALALDNLTVNLDSYVGMAQNYYLYKRPSDGRWTWIPWDPSLAFGGLAQGLSVTQMQQLNIEYVQTRSTGGGGGGNSSSTSTRPIATKLWSVPAYEQRYREIYQRLLTNYFLPADVIAGMNARRELIRPFVVADTQKLVTQAQFDAAMTSNATSGNSQQGGAPGLEPFITARVASVTTQLAGTTVLTLSASPAALTFAQTAGQSSAETRQIALALSDSSRTSTFTASADASWLTLSAASGAVPSALTVSLNAASLAAGHYTATVTIASPGLSNSPVAIPVTLVVTPAASLVASPISLNFSTGSSAVVTQTLALASPAGASPFTAAVSSSGCGGAVTLSAAAGTTPATLTVSFNPAGVAALVCTDTVTLTSGSLAPATIPVTFTSPNATTPVVSGLANAASYSAAASAPGAIAALFGSHLGPEDLAYGEWTNGTQLATAAGGVTVAFDGIAAPILYARHNQVGAVVPFELAGRTQASVVLSYNGVAAPAFLIPITPASPGIFTTAQSGSGQASVINQSAEINAPAAAAPRGSTVAIYLTGAGLLTPAGATGGLGSASQAIAAPVTVSIGGVSATVTYAGAAPSLLTGLYQVNAVVPAGAASGSVPLEVRVGAGVSPAGVTLYVE